MTLMLLFGAAAVALAAVGIYGVDRLRGRAAAQRSGDAARARRHAGRVFWLVLKQGRTLAIIGTAIGLVVAYVAGQIVSSRIYEVSASDPVILGGATALVVGITLLATMIPAFRSAQLRSIFRVLRARLGPSPAPGPKPQASFTPASTHWPDPSASPVSRGCNTRRARSRTQKPSRRQTSADRAS